MRYLLPQRPGTQPLLPRSPGNSIRANTVRINGRPRELANIYAPSGKEASDFRTSHQTNHSALIPGDLNNHHSMWYGSWAVSRNSVIRNGNSKAADLLTHIDELSLTLHN